MPCFPCCDVGRSSSFTAFAWRIRCAFFATLAVVLLAGGVAGAAPRDKAALKKIDEALTTHYLNMDFDAAEGVLVGTIRACEDKCSASVIAKAWMYVGIVKGAGRNDLGAALDAFKKALAADPNVALDEQVATDQVKQTFAKAKGGGGGGGKPPPSSEPPATTGGSGMTCTPDTGLEIETRRPIPVSCEADMDLKSVKVHFKAFGGQWTTLQMKMVGGVHQATIPCAATQSTGKLRFYVEGLDEDNEAAAKFGTKENPKVLEIASETTADPPTFPGEEPPARCGIGEEPSGGGGGGGECGGWGEKCGADGCCKSGLSCTDGTCESARCEIDSDCKNGATCDNGKCTGGGDAEPAAGKYKKNWIGLHFALDLASVSSDKACAQDSRKNDNFACFLPNGSTYEGFPNPHGAGTISGGFTPSTMRIMLSFERLFGAIGLQARLGYAFNGGQQPKGGTAFFPLHAEVRGKFWVLGTSQFSKKGFRPWVHLGGGMAQIDAVVKDVEIADCGTPNVTTATANSHPYSAACMSQNPITTVKPPATPRPDQAVKRSVTAQKQLGTSFIEVGGGVMFAIGPNHGPVLNLNFMLPVPSVGFVIEPSLGYEFGF